MICYPQHVVRKLEEEEDEDVDNMDTIRRILEALDPWTLRVSLLELNLMFKQAKNNTVSLFFFVSKNISVKSFWFLGHLILCILWVRQSMNLRSLQNI